jgi:hypothetical protein
MVERVLPRGAIPSERCLLRPDPPCCRPMRLRETIGPLVQPLGQRDATHSNLAHDPLERVRRQVMPAIITETRVSRAHVGHRAARAEGGHARTRAQ